jgi:hypothetical protein
VSEVAFIPSDNGATAQGSTGLCAEAFAECQTLAAEPRILDRLGDAIQAQGLVGEDVLAKLVYLAITSRLFEKPVSIAVKGLSASGKSFTVETILKFFPSSAFWTMTGMSERALAYSEEPLSHRTLVIYEAAGMRGDLATYLLRSLLSEGHLRYETVEKTKGGMRARLIEREGPTGLVVTTTEVELHPENETRLLSVPVSDTADQTKAVMRALAEEDRAEPDLLEWISLQVWLAEGECEVAVPFGPALAELIPPAAVRLRRDFSTVLGLVRSHALLHRATRTTDLRGRIVATLEDYAIVRELVGDLVSDRIGKTVRPATRETVDAVRELSAQHESGVPLRPLTTTLSLDRSSVSRRVKVAIEQGYLRNLEDRDGKPAKLVLGDPLPDDLEILPAPATLADHCTVAVVSKGVNNCALDPDAERDRILAKFPDLGVAK